MKPRDRLLFATSGLLYSGPLYAGLAGYGYRTLILFAAFLMVWLYIVRPGDWPERAEDWQEPRAIAWPMLIFAVQVVLVGVLLAIGRAIGGMSGLDLPMPLALPVGLSLAGVLIAWALKRSRGTAPILRVAGSELGIGAGILDVPRPPMPRRRDAQRFVEDVAAALNDFGRHPVSEEPLDRLADLIAAKGMARPMFDALEDAGTLSPSQRQLLVRLALSRDVIADLLGQGRIGPALERGLFDDDAAIVADTARLARERLAAMPRLADELPHITVLRRRAETRAVSQREAAAALRQLADRIEPRRPA